jgi:hypothetical protein
MNKLLSTKPKIDWDAIEPHYRAGIRSLKDIGEEFSVSDAGIIKHAKRFKWTRNLKGKIQALAEKKVSELEVSEGVSVEGKLTEAQRVDFDSTQIAQIHYRERKDLIAIRDRFRSMFAEFGQICDQQEDLSNLGELMHNTEASLDKLNEKYHKVISFEGRVESGKKLVETIRILFDLEAKIFKLHEPVGENDILGSLKSILNKVDSQTWGLPNG